MSATNDAQPLDLTVSSRKRKADAEGGPQKKWREEEGLEMRRVGTVPDTRQAGTAADTTDEEAKETNPHVPQHTMQKPYWFYQDTLNLEESFCTGAAGVETSKPAGLAASGTDSNPSVTDEEEERAVGDEEFQRELLQALGRIIGGNQRLLQLYNSYKERCYYPAEEDSSEED